MGVFASERGVRNLFSVNLQGEKGEGPDPTPHPLESRSIHITLNVENQSTESIEQSCSIEVFLNCFDSKHYDKSTLVLLRAVTCRYLSFVRSNLQVTDYCAP